MKYGGTNNRGESMQMVGYAYYPSPSANFGSLL